MSKSALESGNLAEILIEIWKSCIIFLEILGEILKILKSFLKIFMEIRKSLAKSPTEIFQWSTPRLGTMLWNRYVCVDNSK